LHLLGKHHEFGVVAGKTDLPAGISEAHGETQAAKGWAAANRHRHLGKPERPRRRRSTTPRPLTRQQLINLLSQYKQEWQRLYGIQNITLFGSLARDESTASSDALVHFREVERDAVSI